MKVIANSSYYCVGQCWTNYRVDLNYTCSQCVSTVCDNLLRVEVQVKSIFNSLYLKISFSQQLHLADITTGDLTITAAPISARLLA